MKEIVAKEIAKRVKSGDVLGVGTGSTVDLAIDAIAKRCRDERLAISVVPSSRESAIRCECAGLTVLSPTTGAVLSWGFDGADEVDSKLRLIKGRGAAMLKEKILAKKCKKFVVIVDESKIVSKLGEKMPVPVEVIPEALSVVSNGLKELGALEVKVREGSGKHGAVVTENGNIILDAKFSEIDDSLEDKIKSLVGVVESGIFTNICDEVLIATASGIKILTR
jgi:ribose 5-phosphate isomerase A